MAMPQTLQKKVTKKVEEEAAPTGTSKIQSEAAQGRGTQEDVNRAVAREKSLQGTATQRLQESEANKGAYAGLGLGDRAAAQRMVNSGEAKTRDEAAAMIRKKREPKPKAAAQAGALEK